MEEKVLFVLHEEINDQKIQKSTRTFATFTEFQIWFKDACEKNFQTFNSFNLANTVLSAIADVRNFQPNEQFLVHIYDWTISLADSSRNISNIMEKYLLMHCCLRIILKLEQQFYEKWINIRNRREELFDIKDTDTFKVLQKIITDVNCPPRTTSIAGIALAFFLHTCVKHFTLIKSLLLNDGCDELEMRLSKLQTKNKDDTKNVKNCTTFSDGYVYILNGMFMCGKTEILLSRSDDTFQPFVLKLFPAVLRCCRDKQINSYHSFSTLLSGMKYVEKNFKQIYSMLPLDVKSVFDISSPLLPIILNALNLNWTSPCEGVPSLVNQCYNMLITLHTKESSNYCRQGELLDFLLQKVLEESWSEKKKYLQLGILIKHFPIKSFLTEYPQILEDLTSSLTSDVLAGASSDVYHAILTNKENGQKNLISVWADIFFSPLASGLSNSNSIIRKNICRYHLVFTLKLLPSTFDFLSNALEAANTNASLLALATAFHFARNEGIRKLEELNLNLVTACLNHSDELVRVETFALICQSVKKTVPLSDLELDLLRDFISINLNIDDSAFRQLMLSSFKVLLNRLRDSSLAMFKSIKQGKLDETQMTKTIDFLDWLLQLVIRNLNYGGCYQRRQMCLKMLLCLLKTWYSSNIKNSKQTSVPKTTPAMLDYMNFQGKCQFLSTKVQRTLMICVVDYMDETKVLAITIIQNFLIDDITINSDELWKFVLKLCSSPKTMHCDSGAALCVLLFSKKSTYTEKYEFIDNLRILLRKQFFYSKENIIESATEAPIHGLVNALIKVFREIDVTSNDSELVLWQQLFSEIIELVCDIVYYILSVLTGKSSFETTPSFAEMNEAVLNLVDSSDPESRDRSKLSKEYQLILSCCWLSLKNSCLFLGELVKLYPLEFTTDEKYLISSNQVFQIGTVLSTVVSRCRHRGVIESGCLAFEMFCQKLLISGQHYFNVIFNFLDKSLADVSSIASATSVTRRSAGFPVYIKAIVTSELYGEKKLSQHALVSLLEMVSQPLPAQLNQLVDVPQAHALHILKALVHDSRSSPDLFYKLDEIFMKSLNCFDSPSWAIRNAAMQLYGTLAYRLLGQKKVSDENSSFNSVSMEEFFVRWPTLETYLLNQLKQVNIKTPTSTVYPILSLLGRLMPSIASSNVNMRRSDEFRQRILPLLECPIWYIRKMAAQSLQALLSFSNTKQYFDNLIKNLSDFGSWNHLHGNLYCLKLSINIIQKWQRTNVDFVCIINSCQKLISESNIPEIIRVAAIDVLNEIPDGSNHVQNFKNELESSFLPGSSLWAYQLFIWKWKCIWESSDEVDFPLQSLNLDEIEAVIQFLKLKLLNSKLQDTKINKWAKVQDALISCIAVNQGVMNLEILQLILDIYRQVGASFSITNCEQANEVCHLLSTEDQSGILVASTAVTVWAITLKLMLSLKLTESVRASIKLWASLVLKYSSPILNEDCRLLSSTALTICGTESILAIRAYEHPDDSAIVQILESAFALLQDEEIEVRKEVTKFVCKFSQESKPAKMDSIHPNLAIQVLCQWITENLFLSDDVVEFLWDKIGGKSDTIVIYEKHLTEESVVLFEQEEINVYAERCFMSQIYSKTLTDLLLKQCPSTSFWTTRKMEKMSKELSFIVDKMKNLHPDVESLQVGLQTKLLPHLINLYYQLVVYRDTCEEIIPQIKNNLDELSLLLNFK